MNIPPLLTMPAAVLQAPTALTRTSSPFRDSFEKIADLQDYTARHARAQHAAEGLVSAALILPVLKQIRRSPFNQGGPFSPGIAEKTFGPEFDMQLADRIAQSPRLGATQALTKRMMSRAAIKTTQRKRSRWIFMDKLVIELLNLLRDLLAGQERLLKLALARRQAMRNFEIDRLEAFVEQEKTELTILTNLDRRRQQLVPQFRTHLGRGVEPTVSEIAHRVSEPARSQLLGLAAQLKIVLEQVERNTRINATISETVVKGLAKVLKIVTGLAQHAGLYMRNGRKAALHGIHLLEVTA